MQSQCGAGRRRKSGKKTRRGGGYGFNMDTPIGVGAASVTPNNTSDVGKPLTGQTAAARRRRSKKGGRKSRRRTVRRGGGSIATVGYGYTGTGARGLADATGYVANPPGPVGYMGHQ